MIMGKLDRAMFSRVSCCRFEFTLHRKRLGKLGLIASGRKSNLKESMYKVRPIVSVVLILSTLTAAYSEDRTRSGSASSYDQGGVEGKDQEEIQIAGGSLFEMSLDDLMEMKIVTASRVPEEQSKTTSSVTVITADDLRRMGARTIYDALRTVPGISVDYNSRNMPIIEVRGIRKGSGTDNVLFMLNGHPMNGVVTSAAPNIAMYDLPIANIKRIEVVRGPGSALYGTTAVIGVVNVITKGPDDVDGVEVSIDTEFENEGSIGQKYNVLIGKRFENDIGFTLNVGVFDYDGANRFFEADSVGVEGSGDTDHESIDLQGSLEVGKLKLFGRYHKHDRSAFLGFTNVISDDAEEDVEHAYLSAELVLEPFNDTEITISGYFDYRDVDWYFEFFPPGTVPSPHPLNAWNESGFISDLKWKASKAGGDIMLVNRSLESNTFVAGIAFERQRSFDIQHIANNNPGFLPEVQDVSDVFNWNKPASREIYAGYVEDIWEITEHVRLNLGARYDYYSDFGGTFNPRLSLSWDLIKNCNMRILYGTAFRAPDFGDRFAQNLGGASGDPNADPEEIETFEISIGGRTANALSGRITYFHNELDNLLGVPPGENQTKNFGSTEVDGVEVEGRYDFGGGSYLLANYTFTDSKDEEDMRFADLPRHRGNVTANWSINKHFNLNVNTYLQSEAPRLSGDTRDSMAGYAVVNTTLLATDIRENLDLQFSVYNIFDRGYTYPAPHDTVQGDYPAPGRSFLIGTEYSF